MPSGEIARDVIKSVGISGMVLVPSVCDVVFAGYGEKLMDRLGGLEHVCWLGGTYLFPNSQSW